MTNRPDWEISCAFGQNPFAALSTLTWTDISADVLGDPAMGGGPITCQRGRQSELGTVQAGTLSLTLQNATRRYDSTNTASIYYPYVRPMTRIRLRARWPQTSGTWVTRWTGYVNAWTPAYPGPRQAIVRVRAVDAFGAFARAETSVISGGGGEYSDSAERTALNQIGWPGVTDYTRSGGQTRIAPGSYLNLNALQYMQTIAATENGMFFIGANGFPTFQDRHYRINNTTVTAVFGDGGTTAASSTLSTPITSSDTSMALISTAGFSSIGGIVTIGTEQIGYTGKTSGTLTGLTRGYHGTAAAGHSGGAAVTSTAELPFGVPEQPEASLTFSYDDSLLYNDIQITRAGGTLQEATSALENALNGAINNSVTTITVDDATTFTVPGTIQIDNEQITYTGTGSVTLTGCTRGANGTTAASHTDNTRVFDPTTSSALYGPRVFQESGLYMVGDDEALGLAQWLLLAYAVPNLRITSIILKGDLSPTLAWPIVLARELSDKIEVIRRPPGGGFIDQYARIEQIVDTITIDDYLITWQLSLADSGSGADSYWVLGDPIQSVLGSTTRLAF